MKVIAYVSKTEGKEMRQFIAIDQKATAIITTAIVAIIFTLAPLVHISAVLSPQGAVMISAWLGDSVSYNEHLTAINSWNEKYAKPLSIIAQVADFTTDVSAMVTSYKPLLQDGKIKALYLTWDTVTNWGTNGDAIIGKINMGSYDDYIIQTAIAVKRADYPIVIRINQEMNADTSPYGQNATAYIEMWQRIVNIFRNNSVINVKFLWCANYGDTAGRDFRNYYPGDFYVDWVGIDIYSNNNWAWWYDPMTQLTNKEFPSVWDTYPNKPFFIGEWGLGENLDDSQHAWWVTQLYEAIETLNEQSNKRIIGMALWNDRSWSIENSPIAENAMIKKITSPYYTSELLF